jgi:hypothetical protein
MGGIKTMTMLLEKPQIVWKPNKAESHLAKRIKLGHLPDNSCLETYHKVIKDIVLNTESQVYIFKDNSVLYPSLTGIIKDRLWLVMFDVNGIMETAFPPSNPQKYLQNNPFIYLGTLKELI